MAPLGLTLPWPEAFGPSRRGLCQILLGFQSTQGRRGGLLKLLAWQAPTQIHPHLSTGSGDQHACRIFYEPLAGWDVEGNLHPILAAEVPTLQNGGVSADGMSVTWKLKPGVKWHDGEPFTADDCVFNWEFSRDPAASAYTVGSYKDIEVAKIDDLTIKVIFAKPTPFWADAFVGNNGMLIPKHLFQDYMGAKARQAPHNLKPVGTGPFRYADFRPADLVLAELNPNYHLPNRPYFDKLEMKGGGDAVSAARAVLQTGEYDFAYNLQVEANILDKLSKGGQGFIYAIPGGHVEFIQINFTDPWTEVDGERSSLKTEHPILKDKRVRQALNLLVDRGSIEKFIYGPAGHATANFINSPARFVSPNNSWEFNVAKANTLLDEAGWKPGPDGIRAKDGKKLKFLYQSSVNALRQKTQAIVKQAAQKAGIDM